MTKRAAIYCRYSDKAQDGGYSIEAQQSSCLKFAATNNLSVFHIYIDRAKTGRNDQRPEFQAMMDDAHAKLFDVLIIHSSDRFARNRFDAMMNKRVLEKTGVRMMSVTQPNLYRDTPEDIITESVVIGFDEYYSRILSMHTKKGMRSHIEKGFWRGGVPPYGYKLDKIITDPTRPRSRLIIDDHEAEVVRKIYALYIKGLGQKRIVNHLRDNRILNRTFHVFSVTQINRILTNRIYIGEVSFGAGPDGVFKKDAHDAILKDDVFERAQDIRNKKQTDPSKFKESDYILTGILRCNCGAAMVGHSAKSGKYHYYTCSDQIKRGTCNQKKIPREQIETQVIEQIKWALTTPDRVKDLLRDIIDIMSQGAHSIKNELSLIDSRLSDAKVKKNRLITVLESSDHVNLEDVGSRLRELTEIIQDLETKKSKLILELSKATPSKKVSMEQSVGMYVKAVSEMIESRSVWTKSLAQSVLTGVTLLGENVNIEYKIPKKEWLPDRNPKSTFNIPPILNTFVFNVKFRLDMKYASAS